MRIYLLPECERYETWAAFLVMVEAGRLPAEETEERDAFRA